MDQNLNPSRESSYGSNAGSQNVPKPIREDGLTDLNTSFFAAQGRPPETGQKTTTEVTNAGGIFSPAGWKAGLLALGSIFAGTAAEATAPQNIERQQPTPIVAKLQNQAPKEQEALDPEQIQRAEKLILQSLNPEVSRYERERAEIELSHMDPGAQRLLPIAWKQLRELPQDAPKWQFEALSLFTLTRQLGMEFPGRLGLNNIREICENRLNQMPDGRPLAISICAKGDWNGAFYVGDVMYDQMKKAGYRILYFEANSDKEFMEAMFTGTMLGTSREQRASLVIVGGHGSRTTLHLERDHGGLPDNQGIIDFSDLKRFQQIGLARTLAPGGQIVLDSCSNGEGRAEVENMANFMRKIFPHAMKQGIWSATESYGPINLHFNKKGILERVEYPVPDYRAFRDGTGEAFIPRDADIRA